MAQTKPLTLQMRMRDPRDEPTSPRSKGHPNIPCNTKFHNSPPQTPSHSVKYE